jgi:hypothetical protein
VSSPAPTKAEAENTHRGNYFKGTGIIEIGCSGTFSSTPSCAHYILKPKKELCILNFAVIGQKASIVATKGAGGGGAVTRLTSDVTGLREFPRDICTRLIR